MRYWALVLVAIWWVAPGAVEARRVALVIGNATYAAAGTLPNPPADANLVANALRKAGFDSVDVRQNLGKAAMEDSLRGFGVKADGAEVALIYYAGHGIEAGGQNYLIPVDARLERDRDLEVEATRLDTVLRLAEGAKLRVVVLDACRNNPFTAQLQRSARTRSIGRGLAVVEPEGDTLVVYAAKAGATAADGEGRNSPFAQALARRLPQPGLEISLLFRAVRDDVLAMTGRAQEPFTYGSLSGMAFYFVAPNGNVNVTVAPPPAAAAGPANETLYWQGVLAANNASAYRGYLKRYPKGEFADLAEANIDRLTEAAKPAPAPLQRPMPAPSEPRTEAPSARPAQPDAPRIGGVWQGGYICQQRLSAMQLTLEQAGDGSLRGRIDIAGTPAFPGPSGAFAVSGRIVGRHLRLNGDQWLFQPPGFIMADFEGDVSSDGRKLSGRVLNAACSAWEAGRLGG